MVIELKKFGDVLTSRESGGEALAAFLPTLKSLGRGEEIKLDFEGVSVLTPSWADEFIGKLWIEYGDRLVLINDSNPSVQSALQFAKPNLDFSEITVFEDKLVFSEKDGNNKIYCEGRMVRILIFPYNDADALRILKNNNIKKIRVLPVNDKLTDERLNNVVRTLNQAGIKTS